MIWMYWKKFALMEEHSSYKILYYRNQVKIATPEKFTEEERDTAIQTAGNLQTKMFNIETRHKDILALVPKY